MVDCSPAAEEKLQGTNRTTTKRRNLEVELTVLPTTIKITLHHFLSGLDTTVDNEEFPRARGDASDQATTESRLPFSDRFLCGPIVVVVPV